MNKCKRLFEEAKALHNNAYTDEDGNLILNKIIEGLNSGEDFLQKIGIIIALPVLNKMNVRQLIEYTEEFLQKYERYYSFGKARVVDFGDLDTCEIRRSNTTITVYTLEGNYVGSIDLENTNKLYEQYNILLQAVPEEDRIKVANYILNMLREDVF